MSIAFEKCDSVQPSSEKKTEEPEREVEGEEQRKCDEILREPAGERKKETYEGWRAFGLLLGQRFRWRQAIMGNSSTNWSLPGLEQHERAQVEERVNVYTEQGSIITLLAGCPRRQKVVRVSIWRGKSCMIGCACTIYFRLAHTCMARDRLSRRLLDYFGCFLVSYVLLLQGRIYADTDPSGGQYRP
jgi:hypothetical protein